MDRNPGIHLVRGNYGQAALAIGAAVPIIGASATGAKYIGRGYLKIQALFFL